MNPIIPSIFRDELYHPLMVHFPIALLVTASLIRAGAAVFKRWRKFLSDTSLLLLILGVPFGWLAIYTGSIAEDVVNRVICDPTVTNRHEDFAYWTMYGYTAALAAELAKRFLMRSNTGGHFPAASIFGGITAVGLAAGCGLILFTGHLGATLVYQQAAGVYRPSDTCTEFE